MPIPAPPPRVVPYFGYRNQNRLRLSMRALRSGVSEWDRETTFAKLRTLLAHFASREVPKLAVTIEASKDGKTSRAICTTDREGYCHFDLALDGGWEMPERTKWETVRLRWVARGKAEEATGFVLAPGRNRSLAIISDIDDTIMETGAHDLLRNWRRVLAQMPGERTPVPGATSFYGRIGGEAAGEELPATQRPFFYVSSSPWNLFDYLVAFQKAHGLPLGPMFLRDWSLKTLTGSGHGNHKTGAIGTLAEFYGQLRFALIGDSTQADSRAFAHAVAEHPERIAAVLIRKAPGAAVDPDEEAAFREIEAAGVPLWVGDEYDTEHEFLRSLGIEGESEAEAVVEKTPAQGAA